MRPQKLKDRLFARDPQATDVRYAISQIWQMGGESAQPSEEIRSTPEAPAVLAAAEGLAAVSEIGPQEPNDMKSDELRECQTHQGLAQDADYRSAIPQVRQPRAGEATAESGALGETAEPAPRMPEIEEIVPTLVAGQSLQAQAELCVGRFDQRIQELRMALESVEALGHSAAQELEPLLEAKQSLHAQTELCVSRFDQRIREFTAAFESVEALGQSAAQELEPLRTLQRQIAGLATTLMPMKTRWGELEPLAGRFEPMKGLYQQMAHIPSELRDHVLLLAKSLEPAQALQLRMAELARTLEPVNELAARFDELVEALGVSPAGERRNEDGAHGTV